jgi:hypothetical protein
MSAFRKLLPFVLKNADAMQRSKSVRWLGRNHQRLHPVVTALILLVGGLTAVIVHHLTARPAPVTVAAFHLMPKPA